MTDDMSSFDMELTEEYRNDWMRISYATEYLGLDHSTIYKRIYRGRMRSKKLSPFLTLVSREDVLEYKRNHEEKQ